MRSVPAFSAQMVEIGVKKEPIVILQRILRSVIFDATVRLTRLTQPDLRVRILGPSEALINDVAKFQVEVTNTGSVAGDEVVQLYIGAQDSAVERAPKELKAFARVGLLPGETREVRLEVLVSDLAYYDAESGWVVEPITYEVSVGQHACDEHALRGNCQVRSIQ